MRREKAVSGDRSIAFPAQQLRFDRVQLPGVRFKPVRLSRTSPGRLPCFTQNKIDCDMPRKMGAKRRVSPVRPLDRTPALGDGVVDRVSVVGCVMVGMEDTFALRADYAVGAVGAVMGADVSVGGGVCNTGMKDTFGFPAWMSVEAVSAAVGAYVGGWVCD
ncbi:MAG TPA: hypothetical protein VIQ26_04800 [Microbacteriaceae bacterium]